MTNILTPTCSTPASIFSEGRGEDEANRYEAEAAQTILGPVPLSVAIATTLKQLREECADLFDGEELPDAKAPKLTLPDASGEAPTGLLQGLAQNEERALSIARALAEGCTLDTCGPTCCALGCALDEGEEAVEAAAADEVAVGDSNAYYKNQCGDELIELPTDSGASESDAHEAECYAPVGDAEEGASTAEYGIVMLAAVGFAGLLVVILKSDEVRSMLVDIVRNALSIAGNTGLL
ncbi:DUF4244 domain-containing protein [uncultured Rothia sp.]|uniref:DUF4244 domain-containing protein n=1 Tax=uncultured Rothia sp. TaxID=316088 RepID=UPI0025D0A1BD|nr:DUF4244 domain-containing protein [uncultured Rothia sp.]